MSKPAKGADVSIDSETKTASGDVHRLWSGARVPATTAPGSNRMDRPAPGWISARNECEPYRQLIEEAAGRGRNAMAIFQNPPSDGQ